MDARAANRVAWSIGGAAIALMAAALLLMFLDRGTKLPPSASSDSWNFSNVLNVIVNMAGAGIGILLASRRRENRIGWMFLVAGTALGVSTFSSAYGVHATLVDPGTLPAGLLMAWLGSWSGLIALAMLAFLFLLFPTGHLRSRRWLPVAWLDGLAFVPATTVIIFYATKMWRDPYAHIGSSGPNLLFLLVFPLPILAAFGASLAGLIARFRGSVGDERLQLKWFVTGAALVFATFIPAFVSNGPNPAPIVLVLQSLAFILLFSAIAVAVLRYRLYEIELVIRRAVVYGVLAAFFTLVYLAIVVGIGTAIGSAHNAVLTVLAAASIALAFNPVRDRARRFANRIAYGERATPYEVLSEFAENMAGTYSLEDVLPRTAQMLAGGTGASRADVWLLVGSDLVDEATWPSGERLDRTPVNGDDIHIRGASSVAAVRHQGELLGALSIHKPSGEPVSAVEEKLLADVASQAGLVLRNVRLIQDLRASRQRIVAAQDAERRRIERNIHDGAQQQLVALAVKQRLAEGIAERDPAKTKAMLSELQADTAAALEDLRDLARGIYPPLLADQGLTAALQAQAAKSAVPTTIESNGIGRFPQETEAAVYFCTLEALQNIAKYARASHAVVRLSVSDDQLSFAVEDDGAGFDPEKTGYGTGLQGMADRLAALGGELRVSSTLGSGTFLEGHVPLAASS